MKQQIDIKEVIKKHNKTNKRGTGCILGFFNIILVFIIIICILALFITWKLSGFDTMIYFLKPISVFVIFAIVVIWKIKKALLSKSSCLNNTIRENAKVKIVEGKIVGFRIEDNQTTNLEREISGSNIQHDREYYIQVEMNDSINELNLGIGVYSKFKKDDEVYLFKVNDYYYSDMVFNKTEYELNESSLKALNNEIIV